MDILFLNLESILLFENSLPHNILVGSYAHSGRKYLEHQLQHEKLWIKYFYG